MFSVKNNAFVPADDRAREIMSALKIGDKVLLNVHKARWPEHHRLAFAVMQRIADAKGVPVETVLTWLKVATGRVDFIQMPNGKVVAAPQSISFSAMSQDDFQRFWDECWLHISERILPNVSKDEFEEIRSIVARPDTRAA